MTQELRVLAHLKKMTVCFLHPHDRIQPSINACPGILLPAAGFRKPTKWIWYTSICADKALKILNKNKFYKN